MTVALDEFRPPRRHRLLAQAARVAVLALDKSRLGPWPVVETPEIWIHCASLGEAKTSLRLARSITTRKVILTAQTAIGVRRLRAEFPPSMVFPAPLDHRATVEHFLDCRSIQRLVLVEGEIWPHWLEACQARHIEIGVVGIRDSERSLERWARLERWCPGWATALGPVWSSDFTAHPKLRALGATDIRHCAPLKWAGAQRMEPEIRPWRKAALSIHLRDLPFMARLAKWAPLPGWLWFPRRLWLAPMLAKIASARHLRQVDAPSQVQPGSVWIARSYGAVNSLLPGCSWAWVSEGHDALEPWFLGVPEVRSGKSMRRILPDSQLPERAQLSLREIQTWMDSPSPSQYRIDDH